ncbi:DUF192 domain-containing protein [candidate division CSSED10-310 bacterium]|uniref:DUF192 domain-containing protein n=1 Tax=candidate division CSSED10-310 bacterium TaxID=2855610 RepID=A0ABV6Z3A1_UNCC1
MRNRQTTTMLSIIIFTALGITFANCSRSGTVPSSADRPPQTMPLDIQPLQRVSINDIKLEVEIVDTPETRAMGLMFRKFLAADRGMLFIFSEEHIMHFWMKDTHIPLSIGFFDKEGILFEIHQMKPYTIYPSTHSSKPGRYALEVNQGWFTKQNIRIGSRLIFLSE